MDAIRSVSVTLATCVSTTCQILKLYCGVRRRYLMREFKRLSDSSRFFGLTVTMLFPQFWIIYPLNSSCTATCQNCRAVKPLLGKSGLCFTERDVDEYIEEAPASGLRQAPTLAVQSGDKTELYTGVAQIKALLKEPALWQILRWSAGVCGSYRGTVAAVSACTYLEQPK